MKYMLLIYGNDEIFNSFPQEEFAEVVRETDALHQELRESGEFVGAYGVADQVNAKTVRVQDGVPAVTDGPYIEAKEYLGSFTIVDCERAVTGRRRHADAAVPVLPSRALAGVPARAHAARRRRSDHGGDRPSVPRPRGDDGAAHQPGEATHQGDRRIVSHAARARAGRPAARRAPRAVPDLQRGPHRDLRP